MAESFRIIHFSDPHEIAQFETAAMLLDKRVIGFLNNRILRRTGHGTHDTVIKKAIERIFQEKCDLVIFTGDATSCGQKGEFDLAYEHFRPLVESSQPFLYLPGNHDCYVNNRKCREEADNFCRKMNRGKYALKDFPFVLENEKFRILASNNCIPMPPFFSNGYMNKKTREFYKRECEKNNDGRIVISANHFPFSDPHPCLHFLHTLWGAKEAERLLKEKKIDLALCGHIHKSRAVLDEKGRGEVIAGSLTGCKALTLIEYDGNKDHIAVRRLPLDV